MKLKYAVAAVAALLLGVVAYKGYGIYTKYREVIRAAQAVNDIVKDPGKVVADVIEKQVPKLPDLTNLGGLVPLPQVCPAPQVLPKPIVPKVVPKARPKPVPLPPEKPKVFPPVNPDPDDDLAAALFGR